MEKFNKINFLNKVRQDNFKENEILKSIKLVKIELDLVRHNFEYLNDPKLIDVAIYQEQAAIKKFEYLIAEAKKNGIKVDQKQIYCKACE